MNEPISRRSPDDCFIPGCPNKAERGYVHCGLNNCGPVAPVEPTAAREARYREALEKITAYDESVSSCHDIARAALASQPVATRGEGKNEKT